MKTILFLSDTHGNVNDLYKLKPIMTESDYIIHAGDYYHDMKEFSLEFIDKLYQVKGNCDGGGSDLILEIESVKILVTHGDSYGVKKSLLPLTLKAKEIGADLVLYGHTHIADITEFDDVTLVNPGTLHSFNNKSYCYIVICKNKITAKIVEF